MVGSEPSKDGRPATDYPTSRPRVADSFTPGINLKAWLFAIQRNAFYEDIRRKRRKDAALREHVVEKDRREPHQPARFDAADLERVIRTLSPVPRKALVLMAAQEPTYEQAAMICGIPTGIMKDCLSRASSALAHAMYAAC